MKFAVGVMFVPYIMEVHKVSEMNLHHGLHCFPFDNEIIQVSY